MRAQREHASCYVDPHLSDCLQFMTRCTSSCPHSPHKFEVRLFVPHSKAHVAQRAPSQTNLLNRLESD